MIKLFSGSNKKKTLAISSILVSIIAFVAIAGLAATIAASSGAYGNAQGAVYIIDNSAAGNNVLAYARAPNGQLTATGTFSTNGLGTGTALASQGAVALTQNGRWLLVVDAGSNQISVFRVQGSSLTFASITSSEGSDPISLAISNNLVYVLDVGGAGNIAGFSLSNNGVLTYISGSIQPLSGMTNPSPEQIGFNPAGNVLVVTEKGTNTIDTYTVGQNGAASAPFSQPSAGQGPYGFAFSSQGLLFVSEAATNTVSSYAVTSNGQLRTISGAIPTFGNAPCWLVVDGSGNFAYVANAHGGTLSTFTISSSGGLTLFSSVAAQTAIPALDMAFAQNYQFLYVHTGNTITGYRVFSDGSLLAVASASGVPAAASGLAAN